MYNSKNITGKTNKYLNTVGIEHDTLWYPNHIFHFLKGIKCLSEEKNKSVMEVHTDTRASREEADKIDSSEMTDAIVILVCLAEYST